MTGEKTEILILPAWPACSHSEWLQLRCGTLWKPRTCADWSLVPDTCNPCCLLLESNTVSENIFRHKSSECALREEGSVLTENCRHPPDGRAPGAARCQVCAAASGADLHMPPAPVRPDSFPLSARASDHLCLDPLVSNSSDIADEPADFSESAGTPWQLGFGSLCSAGNNNFCSIF